MSKYNYMGVEIHRSEKGQSKAGYIARQHWYIEQEIRLVGSPGIRTEKVWFPTYRRAEEYIKNF